MTMMPPSTDFTGAAITEGQFKTALSTLRTFLYEKLGDDGTVGIGSFPSGTLMLFQQTAAPTGWTKQTTHNDKALRVVSGTASSGGANAFSTSLGGSASATTLTAAQSGLPSHSHVLFRNGDGASGQYGYYTSTPPSWNNYSLTVNTNTEVSSAAASSSHTHSIAVQYVDLIIASKN